MSLGTPTTELIPLPQTNAERKAIFLAKKEKLVAEIALAEKKVAETRAREQEIRDALFAIQNENAIGLVSESVHDTKRADLEQVLSDEELLEGLAKNAEIENENNEKEIDALLGNDEKKQVAEAVNQPAYNDEARSFLLGEADKLEKRKTVTSKISGIARKIWRKTRTLVMAGTIFISASGIATDDHGDLTLDYTNIVNVGSKILPDDIAQYGKRFLEKEGFYKEQGAQIQMVENAPAPEIEQVTIMGEKPKPVQFFQMIGAVPDPFVRSDSLMLYRSQWDNAKGFRYIPTPDKENRHGKNLKYKGVVGVGHFLFDGDITSNSIHPYVVRFIDEAKKKNDWMPIFDHNKDGSVTLHYKKPNELTTKDVVIGPLRQHAFSDLNWQGQMPIGGYRFSVVIPTKTGEPTGIMFSDRNTISRQSGLSVVFIWLDEYGNVIVRDFAGTVNQIEGEGKAIMKQYKVDPKNLTIGYFDAGSFVSKPKAHNGTIETRQWEGYHHEPQTGSALLIPIDQIMYNKEQ